MKFALFISWTFVFIKEHVFIYLFIYYDLFLFK